ISMTCLNLGVERMSKIENVYLVGVIPGPKEPSLTELNNYIRPLINVFLLSWMRGHHFSRSASSLALGRIVRSVIAIVVNDLPGARRLAQAASHMSHHICTICTLYGKDKLGDTNYHAWAKIPNHLMRASALQWRDATNEETRKDIFDNYGVRWSELWRLPYWNITRQLAPEPMHALFSGLAEHFVCDAVG
ncbi:hypothetical protein GLOTRDRAFT_24381, partial [Gloeophyllum trabeum ATCC 11539]